MNITAAKLLTLICARINDEPAAMGFAVGALTQVIGDAINDPGRCVTCGEIDRAIALVLTRHDATPAPEELASLFGDDTRAINTAEAALRQLAEYAS